MPYGAQPSDGLGSSLSITKTISAISLHLGSAFAKVFRDPGGGELGGVHLN